ncbi:hypothetical protein ACLOJK_015357 [Asimina triloba]
MSSSISSSTTTAAAAATSKIPSKHATISLLQMCNNLAEIKQIHARFVILGLTDPRRPPTATAANLKLLLQFYASSSVSSLADACSVFTQIQTPDAFAYNTMMRGFTAAGNPHASLLLFRQMLSLHALTPDNYTYTFVLKACSLLLPLPLELGKQVHGMIIKAGTPPDTHIHSSLIHMYVGNSDGLESSLNCARRVFQGFFSQEKEEKTLVKNAMISGYMQHGYVNEARYVFDDTKAKDSATWSAMVTGYTRNGMYTEALDVFQEMTMTPFHPNQSMLVSALSACARLGALDQGRWIHRTILHHSTAAQINAVLGTALLDMYAKCGSIDESYQVFSSISNKDVVAWTAMISALGMHGRADEAFQLFDEMVGAGIRPNGASFVAVLSACTHAGRVQLGRQYLQAMTREFGMEPTIEHYGCMINLLGRAGHLAEAEAVIAAMPVEPNAIIWGAMLDACRMHKDLARAAHAFEHVIELEAFGDRLKPIGHVLAAEGRWEEASRVRKLVSESESEKGAACGKSCIQLDGVVHEFVAS